MDGNNLDLARVLFTSDSSGWNLSTQSKGKRVHFRGVRIQNPTSVFLGSDVLFFSLFQVKLSN